MPVGGKLAHDGLVGAAAPGTRGVAALHHEPLDDPVEREAVVEPLRDELGEVGDRDGSLVGKKLELDGAESLDVHCGVMGARGVLREIPGYG